MYTKDMFKTDIQNFVDQYGYDPEKIGQRSFKICMDNIREIDKNLYEILMQVATMENGSEFEMTEEEFKNFLNNI